MHLTWMMLIALYRDNDNLNCSQTMMIMMIVRVREAFKNVLADFVRKGGGVPPLSAKLF